MNRLIVTLLIWGTIFLFAPPRLALAAGPTERDKNPVGESALEVQSWCKGFTLAKFNHDGTLLFAGQGIMAFAGEHLRQFSFCPKQRSRTRLNLY